MQPSVGLPPPLQNAADPSAAKRRRDGANASVFPYCWINLAKLLIRRRIATMPPHAAIAAASRTLPGGPGGPTGTMPPASGPDQNGRADEPDTIDITTISTIAISHEGEEEVIDGHDTSDVCFRARNPSPLTTRVMETPVLETRVRRRVSGDACHGTVTPTISSRCAYRSSRAARHFELFRMISLNR
jgi:hypothetical protein